MYTYDDEIQNTKGRKINCSTSFILLDFSSIFLLFWEFNVLFKWHLPITILKYTYRLGRVHYAGLQYCCCLCIDQVHFCNRNFDLVSLCIKYERNLLIELLGETRNKKRKKYQQNLIDVLIMLICMNSAECR